MRAPRLIRRRTTGRYGKLGAGLTRCHGKLGAELSGCHGKLGAELTGRHGKLGAELTGRHGKLGEGLTGRHGKLGAGLTGRQGKLGAGITGRHGKLGAGLTGRPGKISARIIWTLQQILCKFQGVMAEVNGKLMITGASFVTKARLKLNFSKSITLQAIKKLLRMTNFKHKKNFLCETQRERSLHLTRFFMKTSKKIRLTAIKVVFSLMVCIISVYERLHSYRN